MASTCCPVLPSGSVRAHGIRLLPNDDLVSSLQSAARSAMYSSNVASSSAFVMTAVGSLSDVTLRLANASRQNTGGCDAANEIRSWKERFEVVSLTGTFSKEKFHLHMSVANAKGETFGGHLVAGTVFTTMEVVLGTIENVTFDRIVDDKTGYRELVVRQGVDDVPTESDSKKRKPTGI